MTTSFAIPAWDSSWENAGARYSSLGVGPGVFEYEERERGCEHPTRTEVHQLPSKKVARGGRTHPSIITGCESGISIFTVNPGRCSKSIRSGIRKKGTGDASFGSRNMSTTTESSIAPVAVTHLNPCTHRSSACVRPTALNLASIISTWKMTASFTRQPVWQRMGEMRRTGEIEDREEGRVPGDDGAHRMFMDSDVS